MRVFRVVALLIMSIFLFTGCDSIRSFLGKPTSADIEILRNEKAKELAASRDSALSSVSVDTSSVAEQPSALQPTATKPVTTSPKQQTQTQTQTTTSKTATSVPSKEVTHSVTNRYYVIMGAFDEMVNADKYAAQLESKGLKVTKFKFKNGFNVIALGGFNTLIEAQKEMNRQMEEDDCPEDIWVYDSNTKKHR